MVRRTRAALGGLGAGVVVASLLATSCGALAPPATGRAANAPGAQVASGASAAPREGAAGQPAPREGVAAGAPREGVVGQAVAGQVMPVPPVGGAIIPAGIVVAGEGTVRADPDIAQVSAGVQTRGSNAREAQDANTAAMTSVLARLKALGIAEDDIKTTGVSLNPVYEQRPNQTTNQITGYAASNTVMVTVRDIRRAGEILDAAITAGANVAGGVRFGIKDDEQYRRQAVDAAVKSARARADAIAAAAGVRIAAIQSITDESEGRRGPPELFSAAPAMAPGAARDVPVQPGQMTITGRVRIVYTMQ